MWKTSTSVSGATDFLHLWSSNSNCIQTPPMETTEEPKSLQKQLEHSPVQHSSTGTVCASHERSLVVPASATNQQDTNIHWSSIFCWKLFTSCIASDNLFPWITYLHAHTQACTHTCMLTRTPTYPPTHTQTHTHTHVYTQAHTGTHTHTHTRSGCSEILTSPF